MGKKVGDFEVGECFEDSDGWWIVVDKTTSDFNLTLAQNTKGKFHKFLKGYYKSQISQEDFLKREKAYQVNKDKKDMTDMTDAFAKMSEEMKKAMRVVSSFGISAKEAAEVFRLLGKVSHGEDDKESTSRDSSTM